MIQTAELKREEKRMSCEIWEVKEDFVFTQVAYLPLNKAHIQVAKIAAFG